MHQLILITAMSATTGLFGGGKHCGKAHHGHNAVAVSCYSASPCGATYAWPYAAPVASMQSYPATPQAVPAAPMAVPAAPAAPAPATAPPAPPAPAPAASYPVPTGRPLGHLTRVQTFNHSIGSTY